MMMTTNTGNLIWTTNTNNNNSTNGTVTLGSSLNNLSSYYYDSSVLNRNSSFSDFLLTYLSESELSKILDTIKSKNPDSNDTKAAMEYIVTNRHCSEEFILKYLDPASYLVNDDGRNVLLRILSALHEKDIKSGDYKQIALLLALME